MTLGSDKSLTLLQKMKSTFRGERFTSAMSELLRGLFLQALPKRIKLHLVGESNLLLDNLAVKTDAIYLKLFPGNVSLPSTQLPAKVTSPDRAPNSTRHAQVNSFISKRFFNASSSTNKSSSSDCFNTRDVPDLCWYHLTYGPVNARKCLGKPCPMFPCLHMSKNVCPES